MKVEEYIVARVNALMHTQDATIVKRLEGGMSNYTYVVETRGKRYTYRVPGKYAEKFVDRVEEWDNIQEVNRLGLNNATSYVEIISGEKLAEYVEGTIVSETDVVSYNDLSRLDKMRQTFADIPLVPCHCDYQPTNLVVNGDKLYVLDWEFAGMNDPFYDIACYGNAGFDKALSLLEAYVGHKPTSAELRRLYFHRAFQCLQWYNVAIYKDRVGLSKDLNMDFNQVAAFFFGMARDLVGQYDQL